MYKRDYLRDTNMVLEFGWMGKEVCIPRSKGPNEVVTVTEQFFLTVLEEGDFEGPRLVMRVCDTFMSKCVFLEDMLRLNPDLPPISIDTTSVGPEFLALWRSFAAEEKRLEENTV
jgi:hypothetical protein